MQILIPSRLSSTRVPRKALVDLNGTPMIRRVVERAMLTKLPVAVCTDSEEIRAVITDLVPVVMTPSSMQSGTDRIAFAAREMGLSFSDHVIDVQGDDPFVDPVTVLDIANRMRNSRWGCFVPFVTSQNPVADAASRSVVKILQKTSGEVFYMTRYQSYTPEVPVLKHSSVIGFVNWTLQLFSSLPVSNAEKSDSIELMRLVENNIPCFTWEAAGVAGISIDTPDDLERALQRKD